MALILSLRAGDDFYVGGKRVLVTRIHNSRAFTVSNEEGNCFSIREGFWTEVYPEVRVKAGIPRYASDKIIRVMVDAPDLVNIVRGELYKKKEVV